MILKKYKNNSFIIYSILIFYLLLLIKININFSYKKIIYHFHNSGNLYSNTREINFSDFHKSMEQEMKRANYYIGVNIFKFYNSNISVSKEKLEYIFLFKRADFKKKNVIVQNFLCKKFNCSFEVIDLNLNFLIIYYIKSILMVLLIFLFFNLAKSFNN